MFNTLNQAIAYFNFFNNFRLASPSNSIYFCFSIVFQFFLRFINTSIV